MHNTISENRCGISLPSMTLDFNASNNSIFNNTEFGINATNNGGYKIIAINNWWGDDSGPHHSENNTVGKGDNVTDYVEFSPWIGEKDHTIEGEGEDEDGDRYDTWVLYLLILILIVLVGIVFILIFSLSI